MAYYFIYFVLGINLFNTIKTKRGPIKGISIKIVLFLDFDFDCHTLHILMKAFFFYFLSLQLLDF